VSQAGARAHGAADWLEQRQPGDLVDEARSFARQRPGTFLIGAAVVGVLAGRLTRGAVAAHSEDGASGATAVDTARPTRDASNPPIPAPVEQYEAAPTAEPYGGTTTQAYPATPGEAYPATSAGSFGNTSAYPEVGNPYRGNSGAYSSGTGEYGANGGLSS
jgi:hypothetical protein